MTKKKTSEEIETTTTESKEFTQESVSPSGAPSITFQFKGDTCRAELAGAQLYAEASRADGAIDLRLTAADGTVLADVVVNERHERTTTENIMDVGSALLWSHWRFINQAEKPVVTNRAEFASYKLDDGEYQKAQAVRLLFSEHLDKLEGVLGTTGRELAIVKTKLEEACMFAVRAVVKNAVTTGTASQV